MKIIHVCLLFSLLSITVQAATIDTVSVYSKSMNKNVNVMVIVPEKQQTASPVIYLLHGYSGSENQWPGIKPSLPEIADKHGLVFVCPDGKNSWYWDSPLNPSYRYETFVSSELVNYIDNHYPTKKERESRAITGLSMGGHGALWIAFRHTDTFGAAGSTSGGVDIRPFPKNWEMSTQLGEKENNEKVWNEHTVINQVDKIKNGGLAIIFDCGTDDFFFEVNNNFHQKLLDYKINHDYIVRPGGHDNNYWRNSIDYQILFFVKYFNKSK